MEESEIVEEFQKRGIILRGGHFRYTSGKHGEDYIDKNALLAQTDFTDALVHEMAMRHLEECEEAETAVPPDVIVGPAMSGAILAHLVAHEYARVSEWFRYEPMLAAFAEKHPETGLFRLARNYDKVVRGRNVLVVEDVINTGGTAMATAHSVIMAGGTVVGVSVIWNRGTSDKLTLPGAGGGSIELPVKALVHEPLPCYTEADCRTHGPCSRGDQLNVNFGHGAEFLAKDRHKA